MNDERGDAIRVETPFHLGPWHIDPRKNVIESRGHRVRVEPKAMRVLVHLARHRGKDVARSSLIEAVWDGAPVRESVLTNVVWELRRTLCDNRSEPDFIQTVPGKGYRLVAPVKSGPLKKAWPKAVSTLYALGLVLAFLLGLAVATLAVK